ncbi:hypothetical protein [Streptomyces sp. NPDC056948]|uniref:hypothetical protein n=1 Tax=Streptomyces sp. NPDC056948 TaxID=3345975 RepID=UPI003640B9A2
MRALPARRIAYSALCAALLVGITGPVAMAADPARGHGHVASDARLLPGADVRLVQIGKLNWGTLTPVADLLNAVLHDNNGRLTAAEATKLGDAAKAALAEVAAEDAQTPAPVAPLTPAPVVLPAPVLPAPALPALVPDRRAADPVTDLLDLVLGAVTGLLEGVTGGAGGLLPLVDDLLGGADELLAELTSAEPVLQDEEAVPSATSSMTSTMTSSMSVTSEAEPDDFFSTQTSVLTPLLPPAP